MAKQSKKLSVTQIREKANMYNETTSLTFTEKEQEFDVVLYPYFSNDRIANLFLALKDDLEGFTKYKIKLKDDLVIPFILHHTILEFTDIGRLSKKRYKNEEDYYKASIQYFHIFIKTNYFKEIADSFIQEELAKVFDKVRELLAANEKLNRMVAKYQNEIQNLDLKSPELRERVQGKRIPEA